MYKRIAQNMSSIRSIEYHYMVVNFTAVSVFEDEDASTFETELTGLSLFTSYDVHYS